MITLTPSADLSFSLFSVKLSLILILKSLLTQDTPTSAINIYGESKAEAEKRLLGSAMVVRFSHIFGSQGMFFRLLYGVITHKIQFSRLELVTNSSIDMTTLKMENLWIYLWMNIVVLCM